MPHERKRGILPLLERRLGLFPIVGIVGARQTGKSTLLRDLLPSLRTVRYVSLDREEVRARALRAPSLFVKDLESDEFDTVCIDEIQKVPGLFDTLKAEVDERKRPGRFAISGSVEFSKKIGVRESLTGRIALLPFFPLNLAEIEDTKATCPLTAAMKLHSKTKSPIDLKAISSWLNRGGMPGIFAVRDPASRAALFESWIDTTCAKDLAQFGIPKFNPDLARRILRAVAQSTNPGRLELARAVDRMPRQIEAYIQGFKALFMLYEMEPAPGGTGREVFHLFDAGIGRYLGANDRRCLQSWFINECFSQFSYAGLPKPDLFFYRSPKRSEIDFVVRSQDSHFAIQLTDEESPTTYTLRAAYAFTKKNPGVPVYVVAPCLLTHRLGDRVFIVPWTSISA